MQRWARGWHLATFAVVVIALVLQLVLVWQGHGVLDESDPPDLGQRLVRFVSYFTILSNALVAWTVGTLAFGVDRDTVLWRVLRLNAVVGIAVTGLIHWFFLRPLLDLNGADYLADKLLHLAVPLLALVGWVAFGPRGRVRSSDLGWSAVYPALYMVWTLVHGAASGWYPYPFTDVDLHGYAAVVRNGLGVILLLGVLSVGMFWLDRRLVRRNPTDTP